MTLFGFVSLIFNAFCTEDIIWDRNFINGEILIGFIVIIFIGLTFSIASLLICMN